MAGYCEHRIRSKPNPTSGPPQGFSVWCRKTRGHTSDGHSYWASGIHVAWDDDGKVTRASGPVIWTEGMTYEVSEPA